MPAATNGRGGPRQWIEAATLGPGSGGMLATEPVKPGRRWPFVAKIPVCYYLWSQCTLLDQFRIEGRQLKSLLVVEDNPKDVRLAADTARVLGIEHVEARSTLHSALAFLEKGVDGEEPLPDGIVLDLDLGYESGYELLRHWHSTPRLSKIPLIVWSILGEEQRDMCKLFNVNAYVAKWEGPEAFREALAALFPVAG
jgi:CheY-like chemotaxis protein